MEKNIIIKSKLTPKFFEEALVEEAYSFYQKEEKSKEEAQALKLKIKEKYLALKSNLEEEVNSEVGKIQEFYLSEVKKTEEEKASQLEEEAKRFSKVEISKEEKRKHKDIVAGHLIVAKRAKIKFSNQAYEAKKLAKLRLFDLHAEYANITSYITGKIGFINNLQSKNLERKAAFDLKRSLTNRKTWANLVPLFMLIIMMSAFFITQSLTTYHKELVKILNSGIFVGIVATGAVFIYSQGGFDMSLGNAALMCAVVAGLVYKSTNNLMLSLAISLIIGAGLGIINAVLATMLNMPVMVMTLTMMNIIAAINDAILKGEMYDLSNVQGMLTNPVVYVILLAVFFLICWFIFNYTKVGRRNKFIGSNKTAAKYNGINLMKAGIISFAISGIGLGLCGFIFINSMSGSQFEPSKTELSSVGLNVIIAIVFGGMTTSGGPKSKVSCAVIGAFFVVFLSEFFNALNTVIPVGTYQYLAKGVVFIVISLVNMWDTRTDRLASGGSIQ